MGILCRRLLLVHARLPHIALALFLAFAVLAGTVHSQGLSSTAQAQDATPIALDQPGDDAPVTSGASVTEPNLSDESASTESTGQATDDEAQAETNAVDGDRGTDVPEAGTPAATPEALPDAPSPSLTFSSAQQPICQPTRDQPETIAQGGALDYDCTTSTEVSGEQLDPAAVRLDWTVHAEVAGGWQVQLQLPTDDPNWGTPPAPAAQLAATSGLASDDADAFDQTATLSFGVRVYRVACGTDPESVAVTAAVTAAAPDHNTVEATKTGEQPADLLLTPDLAPIPAPAFSFAGPLDLAPVPVTSTGPEVSSTSGTITLTLSGVDQSCGDWTVLLRADTLEGSNGSPFPTAELWLTSVNGQSIPDGGCLLSSGCTVASLTAGLDASPTTSYLLGITLTLPDVPRVGAFNSTLSVSLGVVDSTISGDSTGVS